MNRGERPIKAGDSWFSPKCIEVQRRDLIAGGKALFGLGGIPLTELIQTPNTGMNITAVRLRVRRSVVERVRARTVS